MESTNIIALTGLGIGLLAHIVTTVWWASRITTILDIVRKTVDKMESQHDGYVRKDELVRELAHRDMRISAAWDKIDSLQENKH